jgi:hypothetical protein
MILLLEKDAVSLDQMSTDLLSCDERVLTFVDDATKECFSQVTETPNVPDWHHSNHLLQMSASVMLVFAQAVERRPGPSIDALVDHILGLLDFAFTVGSATMMKFSGWRAIGSLP